MKYGAFILAGLLVAGALATFASPFASSSPDGLERVAADKGFLEKAEAAPAWQHSPAADYALPGVKREGTSTALAGLVGTAVTFGLAYAVATVARRRRSSEQQP